MYLCYTHILKEIYKSAQVLRVLPGAACTRLPEDLGHQAVGTTRQWVPAGTSGNHHQVAVGITGQQAPAGITSYHEQ